MHSLSHSVAAHISTIVPSDFFSVLQRENIGPFVGVPCSLLKSLIAYAADHPTEVEFLNPTHESHAVAIAAGAYMGSKGEKLPMVFMQNSGFGNIVNPLTSLNQIYDIPALLLVTWRAEDGYGTDAPEHWIVGRDMEEYMKAFHLPYCILSLESWEKDICTMRQTALKTKKPVVLCVRKGLFEEYTTKEHQGAQYEITSKEAIVCIKENLSEAIFLSTTGMVTRESFDANDSSDFYMMGSMGLISGISAECAKYTEKMVVSLDGDGALMMHMGLMPYIGNQKLKNFLHVVIDNEAYSSTGGQPTVAQGVDFVAIAKACGYKEAQKVVTMQELQNFLKNAQTLSGPVLLHVKVKSGNDHSIGRVSDKYSCPEVTERFIKNFS